MDDDTSALLALLSRWRMQARAQRNAHYGASVRLRRRHYQLGIPTIVLSAIVSTSVFVALNKTTEFLSFNEKVAVGTVSLVAAVLAAIQTFLRFAERAELHRQASGQFDGILRTIDLVLAASNPALEYLQSAADSVQKRMDGLGNAPELSHRDREEIPNSPYGSQASASPARSVRARRIDAVFGDEG